MHRKQYIFPTILFLVATFSLNAKSSIPDLLLGMPELGQAVETTALEKGVIHYQIERGHPSHTDHYTLSTGVISNSESEKLAKKLTNLKIEFEVVLPPENGPFNLPLGLIVNVGRYSTSEAAKSYAEKLNKKGLNFSVRHTSEDGDQTSGPFVISILKIDLNVFEGRIVSALAKNVVKGKQKTTEIAEENSALAAVNAGFFAWSNNVGVPGDLAGLSVVDGEIISEATEGRSALLIRNNGKISADILEQVSTNMWISHNGMVIELHGKNRQPGRVLNCGNKYDPVLTRAAHDYVCKNENELVIIDENYGENIDIQSGQVMIVEQGIIKNIIQVEHGLSIDIPQNGFVLNGIGVAQELIKAEVGDILKYGESINSKGSNIKLTKGDYAFNGGPRLLKNGMVLKSNRALEGWDILYPEKNITNEFVDKNDDISSESGRAGFYHSWIVRRHPRTAIGLTPDNQIFIATVYGRRPNYSAGASVTEMALLLRSLGATEAFNLDGGGSSVMVVNGKMTGKPSDVSGEREVGDALLILN